MPGVNVSSVGDDLYTKLFHLSVNFFRGGGGGGGLIKTEQVWAQTDLGCQEQPGHRHELLQTFLKGVEFCPHMFLNPNYLPELYSFTYVAYASCSYARAT